MAAKSVDGRMEPRSGDGAYRDGGYGDVMIALEL
jgi:hypothetical protein